MLFAALPTCCLLFYVLSWTMAIQGGFNRDLYREKIRTLKIEQAELEAKKRALQSPEAVMAAAKLIGMEPAAQREYANASQAPVSKVR